MDDLIITQVRPGVAKVSSTNPFDTLVIHRIERTQLKHTPEESGIYLLYGASPDEGKLTVYIGMSTKSMRDRIRTHHVNPRKNWFGVLFAVPIDSVLCPAVEAELIRRVREAGVDYIIDNEQKEGRYLDSADIHVQPAVESISNGLQLVLGSDIFTPVDAGDAQETIMDKPLPKVPPAAKTVIEHGQIENGSEVSLILDAFTLEQQERVKEKVAEDARYAAAKWINSYPRCLLWEFDGEPHSPSGLIEKILLDLGFGDQKIRGTIYWQLPNGNSIKDEADGLFHQEGTGPEKH